MSAHPTTAMVLAAGLGTRMRPLTNQRPKPLINVANKALIDYTLDRFAAFGVKRAIVNVHYFADMLEAHLTQRNTPEIFISDERSLLLETGGGLKKAEALIGADPIFCTNTDAILIDDPVDEACSTLCDAWDESRMDALLLVTPHMAASGYDGAGDFHLNANSTLRWREEASAPFIYTGLQIIHPRLLDATPKGPFSLKLLWDKAFKNNRLCGVVHRGSWMHVGDPAGLKIADERLQAYQK